MYVGGMLNCQWMIEQRAPELANKDKSSNILCINVKEKRKFWVVLHWNIPEDGESLHCEGGLLPLNR